MIVLLIVGLAGVAGVLCALDRLLKARSYARRRRAMSVRLAAATVRAEEQHEQRQAGARASAELTSVMPAIERPPLTLPAAAHQGHPAGSA